MSTTDSLQVATYSGLLLQLERGRRDGQVHGVLLLPEREFPKNKIAFLFGGAADAVRVEARTSRHFPPSIWIGGANVNLTDEAAATAQAWLDARTGTTAVDQPLPNTLPGDIATPAAPEHSA